MISYYLLADFKFLGSQFYVCIPFIKIDTIYLQLLKDKDLYLNLHVLSPDQVVVTDVFLSNHTFRRLLNVNDFITMVVRMVTEESERDDSLLKMSRKEVLSQVTVKSKELPMF